MADPYEPLRQAAKALEDAVQAKKRAEDEARRMEIHRAVVNSVSQELPGLLEPLLENVAESSRINTEEVVSAIKGITIEQPLVNVSSPEVNVPKPEVTVNVPEIKIPDIKVPDVRVPEIKIPKITVPKPEVTVNIPENPPFPDEFRLKGVSKTSPLPVALMGPDGKPAVFGGGGGFSGKTDFFTIKDIQASSGASLIDADGFLKVTGAFSVTSSGSSTVSLVNSDGTYYNSDNPLPVTGTFTPADVQAVSQVSGHAWSVSVNDIFRTTTATNLINSDDRLRVSLETGGSGLTDSELRATAVPVAQVSGATWSTYVTGSSGTIGVVTIDPDGNPTYASSTSGLTDSELRATAVPVSQVSGARWSTEATQSGTWNTTIQDGQATSYSAYVAGDFKTMPVAIMDGSGAQITSFGGGTQYADGATASTPTGTVALGDTGEESGNIFSLATFSGVVSSGTLRVVHAADVGLSVTATQTGTWNIGTVTTVTAVTGITNSVASALIDSGGVQYSTSNPVPVGDAGGSLTVDGTVAVSGITGTLGTNVVDSSGVAYTTSNPLPVGDAGGSLTVDGTVTVSSITNSVAANVVDSSGVAFSGSNPVPVYIASEPTSIEVKQISGTANSVNVLQWNGNTVTVGTGYSDNALRVVHATDVVASVAITGINGPVAQGDAASALRVVVAGNSDVSVTATQTGTWNIGTVTTLTGITNSLAANIVDSGGVAYTTSNPVPVGDAGGSLTVDGTVTVSSITASTASAVVDSSGVMYGSANPFHIAVHDSTGSTISSFPSGDIKGLAVAIVDGSGNQITSFGGGTQYAEGATASTYTGTAVIFAEASTDVAKVVSSVDPLPVTLATALSSSIDSVLSRPIKVRGSLSTAYATLNTNTETTLIAASAGKYLDMVWVKFSNTSSGAVNIDLRDSSAGNIVDTYAIPANATQGISMAVPYPQGNVGNAWTVDFNTADVSNTTVYVSALFSQET